MTRTNPMLTAPIPVVLRQMTGPMIFGIIAILAFNLVDTFFIGMLGTQALAAISFTFPVTFVVTSLAMALGAVIRHLIGTQPFVYVLGRAFLGTAVCLFLANVLGQWSGHSLPGVEGDLSLVARWLMAWGDAFVTGMLTAIFVAFKPEWLATWSDRLYLRKPD